MIDNSLIVWIACAFIIALIFMTLFLKSKQPVEVREYRYSLKQKVMTNAEKRFYDQLLNSLSDQHYIVPQAHLSMFIDHKIKGQNWRGAFSRVNGKSVDFLIVEKSTQKPIMAIELDDYTHSRADRVLRDDFVNQTLKEVGLPLERCTAEQMPTFSFLESTKS